MRVASHSLEVIIDIPQPKNTNLVPNHFARSIDIIVIS